MSLFELIEGRQTPLEVVAVAADGEPTDRVYGGTVTSIVEAIGGRLEQAVLDSAALFIGSSTLVGADERELTMRARALMLELERPVIFDPNIRLHRWPSKAEAAASCNACVPGTLLVRASAGEAALMTGEDDPERASLALVKAGARLVVITLGSAGGGGGAGGCCGGVGTGLRTMGCA